MNPTTPYDFLSVQAAAERLGITTRHIARLADSGELPCLITDTGRRVFWPSAVERVARERERERVAA